MRTAIATDPARERAAIDRLAVRVQGLIGIQLEKDKHEMVRSRLLRRLAAVGAASFEEYGAKVDADASGSELSVVIDLLTTHKTAFFREPRHFEVLSSRVERRARNARPAVIWSAACSTGPEPYSIAMACRGVAGNRRPGVRILATDVSRESTEIARRARYPRALVERVPEQHRHQAFRDIGGGEVEVTAPYRAGVDFARLNLIDAWPMRGCFDFVFCRNVMIYFDRAQRMELVRRISERLVEGGLLFIGMTESFNGIDHALRYVEPGVYERC